MGADHTQEDCALAPLQPKAVKQVAQVGETKLEKGGGGDRVHPASKGPPSATSIGANMLCVE